MDFIRVYNRQLEPIAEIDEFSSCIFTKRFFEAGEWELHLAYRQDLIDILKDGMYFLVNNDPKKVGIIGKIEIPDNGMAIFSGTTLSGVFARRIVVPNNGENYYKLNYMAIESIMYGFVGGQCLYPQDIRRKFNDLTFAPNKFRGVVTNWRASFQNVLSEILFEVGTYGEMGYDLYLDIPNKKWVFEVIQGRNLTTNQTQFPPVIFSSDLDNLDEVTYYFDRENYKNAVYAFMGDLELNQFTVYIDREENLSGYELSEVYLDATSQAEDTIELEKAAGIYKKETIITENLVADILDTESFKYEKDWFLGDIVEIVHNKTGKIMQQRVTEVTEVLENGNQKLAVVFGMIKNNPTLRIANLEKKIR